MYRDRYGLIVTKSWDGGDSLRYEGAFWLANKLRAELIMREEHSVNTPAEVIDLIEPYKSQPGVVVRNPNPSEWWSDPKNTSRDQTLSAFIIAQLHDRDFLDRLVRAHRARWWLCSNNSDILWFTSVVPRARGGFWNIMLYVTDWFFFFDFLSAVGAFPVYDDGQKKWKFYDPKDTGKFWNLCLAMCQPGYETFIRKMARWIFGHFARKNAGTEAFNEPHPVAAALQWECMDDTPDLGRMWKPLVYFYFPRRFRG
jgi:hypothetical protein